MSETQKNTQSTGRTEREVSHFINRKLIESAGSSVAVNSVVMSISSVVDVTPTEAREIISLDGDTYTVRENSGGADNKIIDVSPIGDEPDVITDYFGTMDYDEDFSKIDEANADIAEGLSNEYNSLEELSEASPEAVTTAVNEHLDNAYETPDDQLETDLSEGRVGKLLGDQEIAALVDEVDSIRDLVRREATDIVAEAGSTLTPATVSKVQRELSGSVTVLNEAEAEDIIASAEVEMSAADVIARENIARHEGRKSVMGTSKAEARVTKVEDESETVGEPISIVRDNVSHTDPEALYVSDIRGEPTKTGLPVLEDVGYEHVPKTEDHPDAGHEALPTDETGNVIKPTIPLERDMNMPTDELVAKKLARGVPFRLWGPSGSGKNYLLKYICNQTNRGYRNVVAHERMVPSELFGPVSPNRNGIIEPKNGEVKQGLLNGDVVVIDEFNTMSSGCQMALHQLLNENRIVITEHNEQVDPHPQARIVTTMNPPNKEYRDAKAMNRATRGRFRSIWQGYPDTVDDEVRTLHQQVNNGRTVVKQSVLRKIVEIADTSRDDSMREWPTLSTRALTIVAEQIDDGAGPAEALLNVMRGIAEPNRQNADAAREAINDKFRG